MDDGFSWRDMRESTPLRLPGPDNLGWWTGVAFFVAVLLHVAAFFALGHLKIGPGFSLPSELQTESMKLEQVVVLPPEHVMETPEEVVQTPPDSASLLEEIDILSKLPEDTEIDIRPDLNDPEFAIKLENPALEGNPEGIKIDPAAGFDLDTALPNIGRTEDPLPIAAEAQTIVDPGAAIADSSNLDRFAEDLLKKGAGGTAEAGTLDGVVSLDDMVGLPADVLVGKMTLLPSDLLFEYDSAELRESARVGLMKLAMIIEKNPNLYCWIEGHSDLHGSDIHNLELSKNRAASVREYLTRSLGFKGDRIVPRGFGKAKPIIAGGSVEDQAPNRRVEIRLRRKPPSSQEPVVSKPPTANPVPVPRKAQPVLVKPMRALPVEEAPPRAAPVPEEDPPKAAPVEEEPPRAQTIEEAPLRGEAVE